MILIDVIAYKINIGRYLDALRVKVSEQTMCREVNVDEAPVLEG